MAEFGENLKKVREEKGITQQTLADHLYVTRQAVSRWEGGSRYPDIMTAKKLSQFLGVSLDDLLSDDDMKLYVERNAILDSSMSKRVQVILISLAFMCAVALSIIYVGNYVIQDGFILDSKSEMVKNILLMFVLGYGLYAAACDKLNPKLTIAVVTTYVGIAIITGVICGIWQETDFTCGVLFGGTAFNIMFLIICIRFLGSKKVISPIPLYITAGIYAVLSGVNFFYGFTMDIPNEIFRDVFILHMLALIEGVVLLALLVVIAYTLHKKRKLAGRQ